MSGCPPGKSKRNFEFDDIFGYDDPSIFADNNKSWMPDTDAKVVNGLVVYSQEKK